MIAAGTVDDGDAAWRQCWLPHVASALLTCGEAALRDRVSTYLLPGLMQMDDGALASLLRALLPGPQSAANDQQVAPRAVPFDSQHSAVCLVMLTT